MNGLLVGMACLVVNAAYLYGFPSATLAYYLNVALHPLLGVALVALAARRHWSWASRSAAGVATGVLVAAVLVTGLIIAFVGATRANAVFVTVHTLTGAVATAWLVLLWHRVRPVHLSRWAVGGALALLVFVAAAVVARSGLEARQRAEFRIQNPRVPPLAMTDEGPGPESPFFPSSADTNVRGIIPANFFMTSEMCGRCHKDIYDQWNSSAHHFSSFNNQWYRKSIEYMQDVVGTQPSKWCAGCHDHAVFFNGRFDRPIREQIDTPEAQAGLGCTSCHSISHVRSTMGQGDFVVEYPALHDLAASEQPILRATHDLLTYLAPRPHRDTFLKPFHREQTAEFCSACHKVHLDIPVNGYRWIRGFNDYDNWQASGVSGLGARSFYYPAQPAHCGSCHMPLVPSTDPSAKNGMVRSHRFPGANTALPFVNRDAAQLDAVQKFLTDGQVSIDLFGIIRAPLDAGPAVVGAQEPQLSSTFAVGEESSQFGAVGRRTVGPLPDVLAPLDLVPVAVRRGESVLVEVVVRTRRVGHFFPGGTVDAFDVWVEFEAVDDRGRVIRHSGGLQDGRGAVDPSAHLYRSLQLDEHGNPINKRNAWMSRSVAYVRLIPPGAADTLHYRLDVPADAGERITLRAKVNYRKFAWWTTQWSFAGEPTADGPHQTVGRAFDDRRWTFTGDTATVSGPTKQIPDLPVTVMASADVTLAVLPADAPLPAVSPRLDQSVRERWNDYGIGLLLQGDLSGAEAAFRKVMAMDPAYADGPVNVARVLVQEGDVDGAIPLLTRALDLSPGLAKAHYFMALALKAQGQYDDALSHLTAAAAQYPRDRVVLGQMGRVQFLQRKYEEAVATLERVLDVDPEDLMAHYNLMLAYQGLGRTDLADRERQLYERFKADEASQSITGDFRLQSPHDNNERQAIHAH
ncbi:MAG: tetratricopeptide repeat protein [Vicinamibacterales bacterium]